MNRRALVLLVAASVAACTSVAAPTSTPSATRAPSTSPTATLATASTPPPSAPPPATGTASACPGGWTPSDGGCATPFAADLDGDGTKDRLTLVIPYPLRESGPARAWRVRGTLSSGTTIDATITGNDELVPTQIASVDLNGDGREELVVEVHRGASTGFLGAYTLVAGALAPILLNGDPLLIGFGGSVGHGDGAECVRAPDGVRYLIRAIDVTGGTAAAATYHWIQATYRWEGDRLVFLSASEGDTSIPQSSWPGDWAGFWRFDCFDLHVG